MALTPDDIVNHEFNLAVRGYAKGEVDDLLDRLADQIERAEQDVAELRDRVRVAEERAREAAETEAILKRTLVTAEDAAQRTLDDASARAESVLAEAEQAAAETREDARRWAQEVRAEAERDAATIRDQSAAQQHALAARVSAVADIEERYRGQLRELLESQLRALGELEAWGPPGGDDVTALREEVAAVEASDDVATPDSDLAAGADDDVAGADDVPEGDEVAEGDHLPQGAEGLREGLGLADDGTTDPGAGMDDPDEFPAFSGLKVRVHPDEPDRP